MIKKSALIRVTMVYDSDDSEYPSLLRMPLNGKVYNYCLQVEQPAPQIKVIANILDRMDGYKAPKIKKRRRRVIAALLIQDFRKCLG